MPILEVYKNHNNKYNNIAFAVLRKNKPHYRVGDVYRLLFKKAHFKTATLVDITRVQLKNVTDGMAYMDFACSAAELRKVVKKMFAHDYAIDGDNMVMAFLIFKTTITYHKLPAVDKAEKRRTLPFRLPKKN